MTSAAAKRFRTQMKTLGLWLEVIEHVNYLATKQVPKVGNQRYIVGARRVNRSAKALGTALSIVPFEGAFLYICAEYELAVRSLVEDFATSVNKKVKRYSDLPSKLQHRNLSQSAIILNELDQDRFQSAGLVPFDIISKLFKCLDGSTVDHSFELCEEALSYSRRNFKWEVIKDMFSELGLTNLMAAVSTHTGLQRALGVSNSGQVTSALPLQLDQIMLTRNRIVHRSTTVAAPGASDVHKISGVLNALVTALEQSLIAHYASL